MEDLIELEKKLTNFIEEAEEEFGSEKVMPYLIILQGIQKVMLNDIEN